MAHIRIDTRSQRVARVPDRNLHAAKRLRVNRLGAKTESPVETDNESVRMLSDPLREFVERQHRQRFCEPAGKFVDAMMPTEMRDRLTSLLRRIAMSGDAKFEQSGRNMEKGSW